MPLLGGFSDISVASQAEVLQKKRLDYTTYSPDLSYLSKAPKSSLASQLAKMSTEATPTEPAAPTNAPLSDASKLSAKARREQRLARENEIANARETAASGALGALVGEGGKFERPRNSYSPSKLRNHVDSANSAIQNTKLNAEVFQNLAGFDPASVLPIPSAKPNSSTRRPPRPRSGSDAGAGAGSRPSPQARNKAKGGKKFIRAKKEKEVLPDLFEGLNEADLENAKSALTEEDLAWIPYQEPPSITGPVPPSSTLIEVLNPSAQRPALVVPGSNEIHPISTNLVSSFTRKSDYSGYVSKGPASYKTPPSKDSTLRYAQEALAHNASISIPMRQQALRIIAQVSGVNA